MAQKEGDGPFLRGKAFPMHCTGLRWVHPTRGEEGAQVAKEGKGLERRMPQGSNLGIVPNTLDLRTLDPQNTEFLNYCAQILNIFRNMYS